jgi:hypothetical protein
MRAYWRLLHEQGLYFCGTPQGKVEMRERANGHCQRTDERGCPAVVMDEVVVDEAVMHGRPWQALLHA